MLHIIWEFRTREGKSHLFEAQYGASGSWARLFRNSPAYHGTVLARDRDDPRRYILVDMWEDMESFRRFKEGFGAEYAALDSQCEELTEQELCLGFFDAA